jgi:hypothetical protein
MIPTPQVGFVHLTLKDPFYLEIPTDIVKTVCLNPLKYLQYVAWCVLGVEGQLVDAKGAPVQLGGELIDQCVYQYVVAGENDLAYAIDLRVIKQRSQVPSETTGTREDFRTKLLERDGRCVWTGVSRSGSSMHIIPFRGGDEVWLTVFGV